MRTNTPSFLYSLVGVVRVLVCLGPASAYRRRHCDSSLTEPLSAPRCDASRKKLPSATATLDARVWLVWDQEAMSLCFLAGHGGRLYSESSQVPSRRAEELTAGPSGSHLRRLCSCRRLAVCIGIPYSQTPRQGPAVSTMARCGSASLSSGLLGHRPFPRAVHDRLRALRLLCPACAAYVKHHEARTRALVLLSGSLTRILHRSFCVEFQIPVQRVIAMHGFRNIQML